MWVDSVTRLLHPALYLLSAVLGLIIAVSVGVTKGDFNGACILYARGSWVNSSTFVWTPARESNCDFPMTIAIMLCLLYGLALGALHVIKILKERDGGSFEFLECLNMVFVGVNGLALLCILTSACLLTIGLDTWCNDVISNPHDFLFKCSDAQEYVSGLDGRNWGRFYTSLKVAQVSAWLCFLVHVLQMAVTSYIVVRQGWMAEICICFKFKRSTDKEMLSPTEEPPSTVESPNVLEVNTAGPY